jgi:hypothetical protein
MLDVGRAADRPEAAREGEMLLGRERLVMQEDDEMLMQRPLDFREGGVGQRLRQIDPPTSAPSAPAMGRI